MDKKRKIGRNDPCPCGSGKKYKKCCGAKLHTYVNGDKEIDYFKLNREIAYKGRIGRQREDFCVRYIKHKQEVFKEIEKAQVEMATSMGETITCQKGCSFCCVQYVDASVQEGEAIVYYLYQNESVLNAFLRAYPAWREKVRESGDPFKRMTQHWKKAVASQYSKQSLQAGANEAEDYARRNIPCPFLHHGLCSIYEVRPLLCASLFATTPTEWCNPSNPNKARVYNLHTVVLEALHHSLFYYRNLKQPVISFMPVMVYEMLKGGFPLLSKVPGLEGLEDEAMNDPEIRPILQRYLKTH